MRAQILEALAHVETDEGCRILFACEAGSRAWGFASPDSDYDVRFIYARSLEWHLRLETKRDTIERQLPGDLDVAGWELAKALRLFAACNPGMNEWFDSPEIYRAEPRFLDGIGNLIPDYFNARKSVHHYLSIAEGTRRREFNGDRAKIKKVFYVLRPLLACQWILERQTMPPTRFNDLLGLEIADDIRASIEDLLARKSGAVEGAMVDLPPDLMGWMSELSDRARKENDSLPARPQSAWEPLNAVMREWTY